ncbi:carboxylating nicotinate-nucleotide diphosphorylase [Nanoarchaeota archaeon]
MNTKELIKASLEEDIGSGDVTSNSIIPEDKTATATILSKDNGVLCGIDLAKDIFLELDPEIKFEKFFEDGQKINQGDILAKAVGNAKALLSAERTVLNFLQRLSGIATTASKYAEIVRPYGVQILDTRKTSPMLRELEKYAVKVGGGTNHRMGLYDMVLIKDNHIKVNGGIKSAVAKAREKHPDLKIEVETENLEMVKEALEAGADWIMLDNMSLEEMKKAVELIDKKTKVEASGGINPENIEAVAQTGVDFISIGSALTNASKSLDISINIEF